MDDLIKYRSQFPILENTVYMISNSLGAMPKTVFDKMNEYAETWATRGVRAWAEGWWELPIKAGENIAKILNVNPDEITMHQNVTIAESIILSCFDFNGKRNKIVYTDMNFPSVMYLFEAQKANGARIEMVKSDDGITVNTQKLLDAIDEETLLVPISHVLFRSSYIQDAKAIIEKAHSVGAKVILDTYQSAGTVPVDLKALNVDFAVGGVLKWLCGGPGGGFLYVRKDLVTELEPKFRGWQGDSDPFAFRVGEIDFKPDSWKFLNGTPAIPTLYATQEGPRIINEVGVDNIRKKSIHQTEILIRLADENGFQVTVPRESSKRGGTVAFDLPNAYPIARELNDRDFVIDYRPKAGIRVSPHFYSKDDELHAIVNEIKEIIRTKAYEKHLNVKSVVT